jgi:hypothetical protein
MSIAIGDAHRQRLANLIDRLIKIAEHLFATA